jgi:hypothetical protein
MKEDNGLYCRCMIPIRLTRNVCGQVFADFHSVSTAICPPASVQMASLVVKNTFLHFADAEHESLRRPRARSAPPRAVGCGTSHAKGPFWSFSKAMSISASDPDAILR